MEDLTYDPRLSEDAITMEDPPRQFSEPPMALSRFEQEELLDEEERALPPTVPPPPMPPVQQFRASPYLHGSSRISSSHLSAPRISTRMVAEDAPTENGPDSSRSSLAPILLDSTPPHSVDVWFAETPVRQLKQPQHRTTMRTSRPAMSLDAQRGTRAAAFVGSFGAVAMAIFIWSVSALAGTKPDAAPVNAAQSTPADSFVMPAMSGPAVAKAGETYAAHSR